MKKALLALALTICASSVLAFPTKVKVIKAPDLLSTEGQELGLTTNKGLVTVFSGQDVYMELTKVKKGQCLILETNTETEVEFNKKPGLSGVASIQKVRC